MDDGSSANDHSSLLDDYDDLLLQAIEESKKLYEEVELPRQSKEEVDSSQLMYQGDEAKGFDLSAGRTWMYPTNYPVRSYQCQIVQSALFHNTLVCLPTGLGKTFIAAVVMYNFYRWYPQGKVIFMAPTKPLVHQQIDACYKVAGVPKSDTAEMTGNLPSVQRADAWRDKRLFFLTPHVVSNDISSGICPVAQIRCVVIDEAHRATGNYSYCQVVNKLVESNCLFRILALSATPGSDIQGVQQVVDNLRISRLELRSEESLDVVQYIHKRKVDTVVVSLTGYIKEVQERYFSVIESYMRNLLKYKVLYGSIRSLSKFRIFKFRDEFRSKPPPGLARSNFPFVEGDFAVCISLYHALELLSLHGLRSFVKYLDGVINEDKGQPNVKMRLSQCGTLNKLLEEVREKLGSMDVENPNPDVSIMAPDGSFNLQETVFSHPKLEKLREVIVQHFESHRTDGTPTRVMVFCQYRETVVEICHILKQYKPLIRPMTFIGQSSSGKRSPGFTQKQQIAVVQKFCSGGYNTLISTCVGEEGLDIGDVDLIVCFDCHNSPIRLVQRMGRTGRKRDGRIVMLMTEGAEYQKYRKSVSQHKSISKDILQKRVKMVPASPRMVPDGVKPSYHEIFVTIPQEKVVSKTKKGKSMDLKTLWGKQSGGKSAKDDRLLDEPLPRYDRIPQRRFLFGLESEELQSNFTHLTQDGNRSIHKGTFSCPSWTEPWKRKNFCVGHSSLSEDLIQLATLISSKKENLPQTQTVSRSKKMEFSDLRTGKNKRKRSVDSKGPSEKKPRKGKVTGNKRPAEVSCDGGVFKVPKVSKKEDSKLGKSKSSIKDLRSYYQAQSSNTSTALSEPAGSSTEAPDVVVIETDEPVDAETEPVITVPNLEPVIPDSEVGEVWVERPQDGPQVVKLRAIFEEVKAALKLERCRDSKCSICTAQKCDVSQARPLPVSVPSEFPDVDELLTSLTAENIRQQRKELLEEPVTEPPISLNFRLIEDIDLFLSQLESVSDSDITDQNSFDLVDSSVNEKSSSQSCDVESDFSLRKSVCLNKCNKTEISPAKPSSQVPDFSLRKSVCLNKCNKTEISPTKPSSQVPDFPLRKSVCLNKCNKTESSPVKPSTQEPEAVAEGLTGFPKLNFDTINAIDQLFEDLDEDGPVSPKLCSSGIVKSDVFKRLSQALDETLSPKGASCPTSSFDSPTGAPKFSKTSRAPACSTPKPVRPGVGKVSRLSRLRSLPTVRPLGEPESGGTQCPAPNFNFNLFLDECDLLFDDEMAAPSGRPDTFPANSTNLEEEGKFLQQCVDMFSPIKRKGLEKRSSPHEMAGGNESPSVICPEESGRISSSRPDTFPGTSTNESRSLQHTVDIFTPVKRKGPEKRSSPCERVGGNKSPSVIRLEESGKISSSRPDTFPGTSTNESRSLQHTVDIFTPVKRKGPEKRSSPCERVGGNKSPSVIRLEESGKISSSRPDNFPGTSTTLEEESRFLLHSVDMFTPVKRKGQEKSSSPRGKEDGNESTSLICLDGSGRMSGKAPESSCLDDSFRPLKRRKVVRCLSPAPCERSRVTTPPSAERSSTLGDAGVTISLLSSDDEDFIPNLKRGVPDKSKGATARCRTTSRERDGLQERRNDFIDYEAEVSHDALGEDEERVSSSDEEDRRFVNDFPTQASPDMHAEYLRSVRSPPVKGRGCFKIPTPRARRSREEVLSDPEESYDDSYEKDSFCVDDEEFSSALEPDTPSDITVLEEDGRTPKAKVKSVNGWRRIRTANDSDSE